ncbi:sulfatase [Marinoscillum furvescens]|uniref:Putative sulfatase n=1 Tax=Marinoscillum furvescens DSM 4134 TaxID=1122208 RepID=A0A3D9KZW5_MARFU|nr:sulfatase [Marinoscillum furvescens]RED94954.1 putative sulfatase [Marinoscillum furvescens DSM 4134]
MVLSPFKLLRFFFYAPLIGIWLNGCGVKAPTTDSTYQNVLFIIVDDLKPTLGAYGDSLAITPNIDKLASRGITFTNAHCNFAVCGPSRGSFLSGLRPETLGILDNVTPLQPKLQGRPTLPKLFLQNGFETIGLGKTFHDKEPDHEDPAAWNAYYKYGSTEKGKQGLKVNPTDDQLPWCYWQAAEGDDEDQADGRIAQKAVELLHEKRDQPFFLAVGFHKPHDPYVAPKKYFDWYTLEQCTPPVLPDQWQPAYKHSLPGWSKVFHETMTEKEQREFIRSYYACVSFMDAQVGKLLDALEATGQAENTLIVFMGDHGYHLGEHNWWNKVTVYEEGTNAPLIVAGNKIAEAGKTSNALVEFIDLYPTFLDLMGISEKPDHLEGESFAQLLDNPNASFKEAVYASTLRGETTGRMVKTEEWRYIEWDEGVKGKELYNQQNDPQEYVNLAEDPAHASVVSELSLLLKNKGQKSE